MTVTEERPTAEAPARAKATRKVSRTRRIAMKPRGWLVKIHRWLSFTTLVWVFIISFTGAWLVFAPTFESWIHPDRYQVTGDDDIGAQAAWDVVQEELTGEQYAYYLTLPVNSRGVYRIDTARPDPSGATYVEEGEEYPVEIYESYFVDPGTGEVNDVADDGEGWTNWMLRGHIYLWQDNGLFGTFDQQSGWCRSGDDGHEPGGVKGVVCDVLPTGDDFVSWLGVAWIVIILTGFHIWYWPGVKRWSRAVRIQKGRGRFTFHLSLHKVIGFLIWIPLLAIAFTGITFAFGNLGAWYDNVTPAQRDFYLWEAPEEAYVATPIEGVEPLDADGFIEEMERQFPDRTVQRFNLPADETGVFDAWVTRGQDPWTQEAIAGNVLVLMDPYSREVLYDGTPEEGNVFDQAWDDYVYPVHTGEFLGIPSQLVWFAVSLGSIALGVTGTVMWLVRHNKRKAAAARQTKKDAEAGGGTGEDDPADDAEVAVTP
jgi:uncharacterized iron-regulated membrane protein